MLRVHLTTYRSRATSVAMKHIVAAARAAKVELPFPFPDVSNSHLNLYILGIYSLASKGSESKPARKRSASISSVVSNLAKPTSRFQAFFFSSIRKRRIHPSLCVAASFLTRIHSRSRQLTVSTFFNRLADIVPSVWKNSYLQNKIKNNFCSPVPADQGCLPQSRFPSVTALATFLRAVSSPHWRFPSQRFRSLASGE